ncbi:MAG: adenylyltransferase/cytidyltransferase family protein [Mariniphaga sp.]|nr:adenylyltransferase/cytidyltransferase family protein [Mariniphaga sp.]
MKIAFFPGKFQPVHLGHIISIMEIYEDYDKIIIGITEDNPKILSFEERRDIFQVVFKYLDKFEYFYFDGILSEINNSILLPKYDICVSGNIVVIKKMNELGFSTRYLERSKGLYYSGTELRSIHEKG